MAVTVLTPTARVAVDKVAIPLALRLATPKVDVAPLKLTVPVGVPAPGALAETVAVRVTICPNTAGLAEEARTVLELSLLTV